MQSHPPVSPPYQNQSSNSKTRPVVQIYSWVTGILGILSLIDGRTVGIYQILLSAIGVYASWDNVTDRFPCICIYALGCFIWTVVDVLYLFLLIAASSKSLHAFAVTLLVSNTFPNLATSFDTLLNNLAKDLSFFAILCSVISVVYAIMATYWAIWFYTEVLTMIKSSQERLPLLRQHTSSTSRPGIVSLGSLSRSSSSQPPSRSTHPFAGRGHRLGGGDI